MTPELFKTHDVEKDKSTAYRTYSGDPETDSDSKSVLIAGERHDSIEVTNVVTCADTETPIPSSFTILRREQRYYGPELLLHSEVDGTDQNYLLTAPGPADQLQLWVAQQTEEGRRKGWIELAEIQAALAAEQPPYEVCDQCSEQIRTVEHERMSALGRCQRGGAGD